MLFAAFAADSQVAGLKGEPRPAFVWSLETRQAVWWNDAGGDLLGSVAAPQDDGVQASTLAYDLAAIGRGLRPGTAPRLGKLRFSGFAQLEAHSSICRMIEVEGAGRGLLVTLMTVPRLLKPRRAVALAPEPATDIATKSPPGEGVQPGPSAAGAWIWVAAEPEQDAGPPPPAPVRTTPLRFVFQTDATGRFAAVSRELAEAIGAAPAAWAGLGAKEVAALGAVAAPDALVAALASRDTWTGVSLDWADKASRTLTRIEMSGLPVFDRDRSFAGFRGFGICRPPVPLDADAIEPEFALPAGTPRDSGRNETVAGASDTSPTPDGAATARRDEEPTVGADAGPAAVEPELPSRRDGTPEFRHQARADVIDLSGVRGARTPADPKVVRLHAKASPPPDRPTLSSSERNAFREIARALGARVEGDAPHPAAPPPADAAQRPRPLAPASPADATRAPEPPPEPRPTAVVPEQRMPPGDGPVEAAPLLRMPVPVLPPQTVSGGAFEEDWTADRALEAAGEPRPAIDFAAAIPAVLVDRLPIGILVARGASLLYANRTLLDLLGYADLRAIDRAGGLERLFAGRSLRANEADDVNDSVLLETADGQTIAVDGRMQRVQWEGETALVISVRRAVSKEAGDKARAAEASAAAAERRANELQAVLDTATDGVVILDGEGRIIGLNRSAEALFGYEAEEVAGKGMLMLFAPESHRAAFDYLDSLKSNGVASVLNDGREVMGRERQGGPVPLFMTIGRLGDVNGDRFCAVLRDMTSFKRAERELMTAKHQAEQASSQKSDFLAKVSHEIRTPLSAIIGFAEVMMEERFGPLGNDRYRAYVRDIHTSGGHVISLINDLLDLSKIEAGKLDLTFTSVSLNDVVQQSVAIMQPQANRDRIIIRTALAANLPNVVADGRSIRQIALNLLSNSIKFTMPGGQVIVSTTLSEEGEAVLRVRDTGVGMSETELSVAMEPFRQVSTSSLGGTGLGLPLTKALVEANRASFAIQSAKNAGTIVEVVFPPTRVLAE